MTRDAQTETVHVIDDDQSMRKALDRLFRSAGLRTHTYDSPANFLTAKEPDLAGCLVLDVRLPGVNGLDFHAQLAAQGVYLPVIFMTGHGNIPMSVRGMKGGAVDFLTKPFHDEEMLAAVAQAMALDRDQRKIEAVRLDLQARFVTLTKREREVVDLVTMGKMNKQVAGALGLSEITVKVHRGTAMRKMGARTLAELVRMAATLSKPNGLSAPSTDV